MSVVLPRLIAFVALGHFLSAGASVLVAQTPTNTGIPRLPDAPAPAPTGNLFASHDFCEFAIYLMPESKGDPDDVLAKVLAAENFSWVRSKAVTKSVTKPTIVSTLLTDGLTSYRAPTIDSLQYFGRGISKEQADELQTCQRVYVIDFDYTSADVWKALRSANEIAGAVAQETQGLVWDQETREMFSSEEWTKKRIDTWTADGAPDITQQITIQAYKDGDYVRAITLGMAKAGLPDVFVSNFVWSENKQIGSLIDLMSQAVAEDSELTTPGQFDLDISKIKNKALRDRVDLTVLPHSSPTAPLGLRIGLPEQGDPNNRLIEITFDRASGADNATRRNALIGSLFGWEDKAKPIRHNEELLAASQRAKDKLPGLRDAFRKGLAPGEFLEVKGPFKTPNGRTEWMWVEVQTWKGDAITGMLKNEPFYIPNLHGGQTVDVFQADVFDYLHTFPDGHTEGNETGPMIDKMERAGP